MRTPAGTSQMIAVRSARLRALIVDDEPLAREGLYMLLAQDKQIASVTQAKHGAEAVHIIRNERPDVIFLDVQMPEMGGFEVVREIGPQSMPPVIFVTAHDRYAIQAFEINALDYLLKPVSRERLEDSLRRVRSRFETEPEHHRQLAALLQSVTLPAKYLSRLAIRSAGKTYFVNVEDVDWMQAAENYVELHAGAARHLVLAPMQTMEASLDPERFLRIHRSLIVNLSRVKEVESIGRGEFLFVLRTGERLQSSRSYHERVKRWMENPF